MYSAICQICGNKFTARAKTIKYCSACVSKAKAEAALHRKEQLNRPPTTDTEFLICLYTYRDDSISRIATDLNRSEEDVQSILNEAKASGHYNMHIQKHLNSVNYKSTLSDDYVDSVWDSEKAGKKKDRKVGEAEAYCLTCGREVVYQVINNRYQFENYCPHCGARMDKEENND